MTFPEIRPEARGGEPQNDAQPFGVQIETARVRPGTWYWKAVRVHHLTPEENGGKHHIFMDLFESVPAGGEEQRLRRLDGGRLRVTWNGESQVVVIDKPADEPGTNLPMWRGQLCSVEALGLPGAELPSDRVTGIHTDHPEEGMGTTRFHHSFSVAFVKAQAATTDEVATEDQPVPHYVLFGPAEDPATLSNLWLAQDYLLAFRPAFGFSAEEAASSGRVTIVASPAIVTPEVETRLAGSGARVERIHGSVVEVAQALAQRVSRGER
jgi:hypothetical protein